MGNTGNGAGASGVAVNGGVLASGVAVNGGVLASGVAVNGGVRASASAWHADMETIVAMFGAVSGTDVEQTDELTPHKPNIILMVHGFTVRAPPLAKATHTRGPTTGNLPSLRRHRSTTSGPVPATALL